MDEERASRRIRTRAEWRTRMAGACHENAQRRDRHAGPGGKGTAEIKNSKSRPSRAQEFTKFLMELDKIIKTIFQQESLEKHL